MKVGSGLFADFGSAVAELCVVATQARRLAAATPLRTAHRGRDIVEFSDDGKRSRKRGCPRW